MNRPPVFVKHSVPIGTKAAVGGLLVPLPPLDAGPLARYVLGAMAVIVVLRMGAPTGAQQRELDLLAGGGYSVRVVEPRFPECKQELQAGRPDLIVVDGTTSPSHGRATAGWMAGVGRFRTVPVLFLDTADRDVARVKKEVPRAQFATWASLHSTAERILKART